MRRPPFLAQIESAWLRTVANHYNFHQILSERTLQAAFWSQLIPHATDRYIFIEPRMTIPGDANAPTACMIPDIVICRKRSVLAIVEFKFIPRGAANVTYDLAKLERVASCTKPIVIELQRFRGPKQQKHEYVIGARCQFGVAFITNKPPLGLDAFRTRLPTSPLAGRCFLLSAHTHANMPASASAERV